MKFLVKHKLRLLSIFSALLAALLSIVVGEISTLERMQEGVTNDRSMLILDIKLSNEPVHFDGDLAIPVSYTHLTLPTKRIV